MSDPGELWASDAEHQDPKAVLHGALRFLKPLRDAAALVRAGEKQPIPRTIETLAKILTATDRLRSSERLPAESFNQDLWLYVMDLKDLMMREPERVNYDLLAEYLPFILQALSTTCELSGVGLPDDVVLEARKARRGVVTERLAPRSPEG
jgi:hypothetical protein